jgi:hypothetical protein
VIKGQSRRTPFQRASPAGLIWLTPSSCDRPATGGALGAPQPRRQVGHSSPCALGRLTTAVAIEKNQVRPGRTRLLSPAPGQGNGRMWTRSLGFDPAEYGRIAGCRCWSQTARSTMSDQCIGREADVRAVRTSRHHQCGRGVCRACSGGGPLVVGRRRRDGTHR